MNKIRTLIGIGFFLITATILIGNNQKCTNLSNTSMKDGNLSIILSPKTAATTNYELDLNITWGGSGVDSGSDIAFDDSGNFYIVGTTNSKGAGGRDAFVAKYNSITGNSLLNITWGSSDNEEGFGIVLDDLGNIYITGSNLSTGGYDAFVAKFDSTTGESLLNITWGGSSADRGYGIALDGSGNIYITGYTASIGAGGNDAFVAKFNSITGESLLNITWGDNNDDDANKILLDDSGNIYITGATETFGLDINDAFIAKFNSTSGKSLLNITWGGSNDDSGDGIALDGSGNIYITGTTASKGAGSNDAFAAKFDIITNKSILNITWGDSNNDLGFDFALDDSGNIYITGNCVRFGYFEAFFAKYDNIGKSLFNITWGSSYNDYGYGIALDGSENVYTTGSIDPLNDGYTDAFIVRYSIVHEYIPPSDDDDDDDDDEVSPIVISGYDLFFLVGFLGLSIVLLFKKHLK